LDVRSFTGGVQDDDVDVFPAGGGGDGGGAGVAAGGADDGDFLVPRGEDVLEQVAGELEGKVLEGQRGAVKKFQGVQGGGELDEGDDGGVGEAGVGAAAEGLQGGEGQAAADEGGDDAGGEFRVGQAAQRAQFCGGKFRPGFGHIEAAVAGEAGEEDS